MIRQGYTKFISYSGVPPNGPFNIDRLSYDIHCFFVFDRKHYFFDVAFSTENSMMSFETNFQIPFTAHSFDFKHGEIVWSPLLLDCLNHYDTLWCWYKLVAWANHDRSFHAKHRWYLFDHRYYWIVSFTTTPCGVGINLKLALITISHLMRNCICFSFDTSFK